MRVFGLIGFPLSHSFSKKFFAEKFSQEGITDAVYENFPLEDISGLAPLLSGTKQLHGLNVTIPYKEAVIPFLDGYNEVVGQTGACNCIKIANGKTYGYNTDAEGFRQSLAAGLQPHHSRSKALILGKGGAAKAVAYVLSQLRISYTWVVRKHKNPVTEGNNVLLYEEVDDSVIAGHELIINTTPLGMYPDIEACPSIPYSAITAGHYLFDLIYNPEKTMFLQKGEERGAYIQNGHPMLILQAEESWRIWNEH